MSAYDRYGDLPVTPKDRIRWEREDADRAAGRTKYQCRRRLEQHGREMLAAAERERAAGDPDGREAWFRRQARAAADGALLNDRTAPGSAAVLEPLIAQVKDHIEILAFIGRQGRGR